MDAVRKVEIEEALAQLGFEIGHGLDLFDGGGHALVNIKTGECVDPPSPEVLALAVEWSLLEGVPGLGPDDPIENVRRQAGLRKDDDA